MKKYKKFTLITLYIVIGLLIWWKYGEYKLVLFTIGSIVVWFISSVIRFIWQEAQLAADDTEPLIGTNTKKDE